MDPTMGATTNGATPAPVINPGDAAVTSAPATNWPAGAVDFNKTFEVYDANDEDVRYSSPIVLTVLEGNEYPVVVVFRDDSEQVVAQFDTNGSSLCGDYGVENAEPLAERTQFIAIFRYGKRFEAGEALFNTAADAINDHDDNSALFAVVPVTVPAAKQDFDAVSSSTDEDSDDDADDLGTDTDASAPADSAYVNGFQVKIGDKVRAFRRNFGERVATVIKIRDDHRKSLFLQAEDGSAPYWAFNKNVRYRIG